MNKPLAGLCRGGPASEERPEAFEEAALCDRLCPWGGLGLAAQHFSVLRKGPKVLVWSAASRCKSKSWSSSSVLNEYGLRICERVKVAGAGVVRAGGTKQYNGAAPVGFVRTANVPTLIRQVQTTPYARSGKKVEVAVRDLVDGSEPKNVGALQDPTAFDEYRAMAADSTRDGDPRLGSMLRHRKQRRRFVEPCTMSILSEM